jgi:hypothetical protein
MLSLHKPTSNSSVLLVPIRSEFTAHGSLYIAAKRTCITGNTCHVSITYCDVTADTENTASFNNACWTVFTELLPGNSLIKSVIL